jgi:hypothetical protein
MGEAAVAVQEFNAVALIAEFDLAFMNTDDYRLAVESCNIHRHAQKSAAANSWA